MDEQIAVELKTIAQCILRLINNFSCFDRFYHHKSAKLLVRQLWISCEKVVLLILLAFLVADFSMMKE